MERYADFADIESCPNCGLPTIYVNVEHPKDSYSVREHIYIGTYGSAIKGKKKCPEATPPTEIWDEDGADYLARGKND